jgi:phosphatidylglycerol lysyltransferase
MNRVPSAERAALLVRRHGWNSTAFQTLAPGYSYAHYDDACVAFVDTGSAWVVAGAPIGPQEALRDVAAAFVRDARSASKRCCFFATESRFLEATQGDLGAIVIGEQPVWDPRDWGGRLASKRSLREQLRRARAKGVLVRPLESSSERAALDRGIARVAERWLATRRMAPMRFLVHLDPARDPSHRRTFVAERGGRLVGFAEAIPVPAREGWLVEGLVRDPDAPNGTGELLIDSVMRWAADSGSPWLTLGLAPLAGPVPGWLRWAKRLGARLYDFEGLRSFKAKLGPASWSPIHLSYPEGQGALRSIIDVLRAFAGTGLLRFGGRTLTSLIAPRALPPPPALSPARPASSSGAPWRA